MFAAVVIPLMALTALVAVPFLRYEEPVSGNWFLTERGRRLAIVAAIVGLVATPAFVIVDERLVGPAGWWPGTTPLVSNGAVPFLLCVFGPALFYAVARKRLAATRNEAVQALFVMLVAAFLVLTATGIWFRGEGMALVWPWQS